MDIKDIEVQYEEITESNLVILLKIVNKYVGFDIRVENRQRNIADARKIFCFVAFNHLNERLQDVAEVLCRHHASVIHNKQACEVLMQVDKRFKTKYLEIVQLSTDIIPVAELKTLKTVLIETLEKINNKLQNK